MIEKVAKASPILTFYKDIIDRSSWKLHKHTTLDKLFHILCCYMYRGGGVCSCSSDVGLKFATDSYGVHVHLRQHGVLAVNVTTQR